MPRPPQSTLFPYTTLFRSSLVKVQRIGSSGSFTHNDVTCNPGDTDNYQMTVTNTGDTSLVLNFTDRSEENTTELQSRQHLVCCHPGKKTMSSGGKLLYTCS